jgi:hypothetical protein
MNKMKNILSLILFMCTFIGHAQEGKIEIIKDPRLDALVRNQEDRQTVMGIPQVPGFRIQLIFDNDKKKIDNLRAKFIAQNPGVDTYVIYNAPNYILKAGNFVERGDALRLRDQSLRLFPTAFIVKEMVNMPRFEESRE